MEFCSPYSTELMKIDSLQDWIVIHSIIYYELNNSVVNDATFDKNCKDLVDLIKMNPETHKESNLYYIFKDFDGSTGFDLYHGMCDGDKEKYMKKAKYILRICGGNV